MKRIKLLLAAFALPLVMSAQENTKENQFDISGQIRTRAEYRNGALFPRYEGELPASFVNNRARLSMTYNRKDLILKFSGQHVGVWGQDPQIDKEGRFSLNEAWARMNFKHGLFAQLGRQALSYDDERILGDLDWNIAGRFHDALKLGYEAQNHQLHLIVAYNQNDEKIIGGNYYYSGGQPYKNMQTLWYHLNTSDNLFKASLLFMNLGRETGEPDNTETKYLQTMGTHLVFSESNWSITGTFYYQSGKNLARESVAAYMATLKAQYKFNDQWSLTTASDYPSGDDKESSFYKAFDPLYGTHHKFYGSMDYFYASAFKNENPGLWDNQIGIEFIPCNKVGLNLNYHYFATARKLKHNDGSKYNRGLGSEIDFQVDWKIMKNC